VVLVINRHLLLVQHYPLYSTGAGWLQTRGRPESHTSRPAPARPHAFHLIGICRTIRPFMALSVLHVVESLRRTAGSLAHLLLDLFDTESKQDLECLAATQDADPDHPTRAQIHVLPGEPTADDVADRLIAQANVVHLYGLWSPLNRLFADYARRQGRPYVISPLGGLIRRPHDRLGWKRRWDTVGHGRSLFRHAACALAFSSAEHDSLRSLGWSRRAELLPLGLNTDPVPAGELPSELDAISDRRCVLLLGPIDESVVKFLRSCQTLSRELEPWLVVVAGPARGDSCATLQAGLRRKGVTHRVALVSSPDAATQRALLKRADLLVVPTPHPQPPVSALQAMAAGVAVLVPPNVGLDEVRSVDAGRLAEPLSPALLKALGELASLPEDELKGMGRRGAELARTRFDWRKLLPRYLGFYRSLV
jgi:glycosyltransferase involved in cell wall biosynthesis